MREGLAGSIQETPAVRKGLIVPSEVASCRNAGRLSWERLVDWQRHAVCGFQVQGLHAGPLPRHVRCNALNHRCDVGGALLLTEGGPRDPAHGVECVINDTVM